MAAWLDNNLLTLNVDKSEFILIGSYHRLKTCDKVDLTINDSPVKQSNSIISVLEY